MLIEVLLGVLSLLGAIYYFMTRHYNYWKRKNIDFIKPEFPFGLAQQQFLGKNHAGAVFERYYQQYKAKGLRYVGGFLFQQPTLVLLDLDLVKHVLTKDFHNFVTRDFSPRTHEYISKHLFALEGQEWKEMRTKLTPTFTSGKMKSMFTLMEKCAEQLQDHIENVILAKGEFEVKDLTARLTTDIIATCAFGLEVNSVKNKQDDFYKIGQLIFVAKRSTLAKIFMVRYFPFISKTIGLNFFDPRVSNTLSKIMTDTIEYRKKNNVSRNDFVDLLLKVKENQLLDDKDGEVKNEDDKPVQSKTNGSWFQNKEKHDPQNHNKDSLTLEQMTAQAFVFFAAGFETAGSATSFCLYELANNIDVQTRLQREIDEVLENHGGQLTYQAIQEMTYMDQVINETLRLYASLPLLSRVCTQRYQVPGSDLVIDEGVRVNIPLYAIHHDPEIYPDPYRFDPDRFSEENSRNRHHYAFMPFGEGPRICIGMRFGRLQIKVGLAAILSRYQLTPAPDTPSTLDIHPLIIFTTPKHPFSLRITKRSDL